MNDPVLFGKAILALGCSLCVIMLLRLRWLFTLSDTLYRRLAMAALFLTRFGVFAALYIVMQYEVPSDIAAAYLPEARAALQGKVPYRDFFTTYSPLFPFVAAIPVIVWDSGKSIVLLAIVMEMVGFAYWYKAYHGLVDTRSLRVSVMFYIFNPLFISTVAIGGQNHVWIATSLGIALFLLRRGHSFSPGVTIAVALVAVKFMVLIVMPALAAYAKRTWIFATSVAAVSGLVCGVFLLNGANVFIPLIFQRSPGQDSSGNIPFLLSALHINTSSPLYLYCAAGLIGLLCVCLFRRWNAGIAGSDLVEMGNWSILLFVITLLISKKAFTYYLICLGFPLCVFAGQRLHRTVPWGYLITLFFAIASIEPSIWYRWINRAYLSDVAQLLISGALQPWQLALFGFCEAVIVGTYLLVCSVLVHDLRYKRVPAQ